MRAPCTPVSRRRTRSDPGAAAARAQRKLKLLPRELPRLDLEADVPLAVAQMRELGVFTGPRRG